MDPRSLEGMASFIGRTCRPGAEVEAAPSSPPVISPRQEDRPAADAEEGPVSWPAAEEPADIPLYAHYNDQSPLDTGLESDWQAALEALESGAIQEATVVGWNRGGLLVQWASLQGFLPASQLQRMIRYTTDAERDTAFAGWVGEALSLRVIEVDRGRSRLVFSERALQWGQNNGQSLWQDICPGQVRLGRVRNLCDFGAFIDLGGIDGLIHISELSWCHIKHPNEVLQIGQETQVYIMSVEPERKRIALSLKKLRPDPWAGINERYHLGQLVQGTVTNVLSFGAFARIEDGVEGLIHISELAEGNFLDPRNVITEGDTVTVRVLSFDAANRRLALSMRQVRSTSNPDAEEAPSTPEPPGRNGDSPLGDSALDASQASGSTE